MSADRDWKKKIKLQGKEAKWKRKLKGITRAKGRGDGGDDTGDIEDSGGEMTKSSNRSGV